MLKKLTIKTKLIAIIVATTFLVSLVIAVDSIMNVRALSDANIAEYRDKAYKAKEEELKNYVSVAMKSINSFYERTSKEKVKAEVEEELKKQTGFIFSIIQKQYDRYNGKIDTQKLKDMIRQTVSDTRYGQSGYFWINDLDAVIIDHPIKPQLNGKNLYDFKDKNGKQIFKEFAATAYKHGEGIVDYVWPKPGYDTPQPKVSFVKLFKPFNWVIGTGEYVSDVSSKMKEEALKTVAGMRYGKSGYFWINDMHPKMIMHPIKPALDGQDLSQMKDPNGTYLFNEMVKKAQTEHKGGLVKYVWPKPGHEKPQQKFSYVQLFEPWNWVIGTGVYVDDIESTIITMRKQTDSKINAIIIQMIIAVVIISLIISLIVSYISGKIIIEPIEKLNSAIKNLTDNKTSDNITIKIKKHSEDELGDVVDSFNGYLAKIEAGLKEDAIVIEDVKRVVEKVKDGILNEKIKASCHNGSLEELKVIFNQMLDIMADNICGDTRKVQLALEKFHNLDFTHRIPNPTGRTSQGLNSLADIINEMLVQNKKNGINLNNSAQTLLSNITLLNQSSNEAAASLEQTAAALEQVTSNISNNTENVINMSNYANELTKSANDGEKLANQTTVSMDQINEEVTAINEAISVIDQISFQTNILSLNAAVEAATAGEAGKGFAVVAQEVRNLASRSAEAANEIKTLVENATLKANDGKNIADKMIHGYHGLNENISKTLDLIKDVETASKEQQSGISQINDAVALLDQQTQQNASVANSAQDIANTTSSIADRIVQDADEKEFIGKESIN